MSDFTIRPYAYNDDDAAKLAVMWNESDDQWPGTFTAGVPMTTERVREWMDRETGLALLVVDDPAQERIVGYGSLWEELERENECYVAVLNVHPAYQGKSLARRMLTQMVDQAADLGYRLMTIETWPSNLKSVPLYKKVGFFWEPDTSVHMENFVPLVRQMPVAQDYFQKHDWYTTFRRELQQVEDDQKHGAMKVYRYHWEEDGESLSVLIDREAKAVAGLETKNLAAYAEVDETEPACGLPYPVRWRVKNKRAEAVNVSVLASGDQGVQISQKSAVVLKGGQEQVIEGRFTVSPDIEPVKKNRPAPCIKTLLIIGGDVVELGTGVRTRPAVKISTHPAYPVLLPGQPATVHVQLHNHLDRPLEGIVSLTPEAGLQADWEGLRRAFQLEPQGYAGLPLVVNCQNEGTVPLRLNTSVEVDGERISGRTERVPLFSLAPGGVLADIGKSGDEGTVVVVENEFFRLHCRQEGGRCAVWDKVHERAISSIREDLGPPFVPSELWFKQYELSVERDNGQIKVLSHARSNNFPGLTFSKEITVSASPLMTLRYRLANEGSQTHTVQLNPRIWMGERQRARLTLPRVERLVRERAALFNTHGDVPEKPEGMAERWLSWCVEDFALGLIWGDDVEKHEWEWSAVSFDRSSVTLEPGTATEMAPFYVYAGPGGSAEVRRAWARMTGQSLDGAWSRPGRKLEVGFDAAPLVTLSDQLEVTLRADSIRELPVDGRIVVEPPEGWRVEPAEFELKQLKSEHPLEAQLRLDGSGTGIGAFVGQLCLEGDRFDVTEPFTLLRLGDKTAKVQLDQLTEAGQVLFQLDNGLSRWRIAPHYHAGVVSWRFGESDVNHLLCAYPRPGGGELGWLKPWFGGIQPMLMPDGAEQEGWPGKLHEEQFDPRPCERVDEGGVIWSGLCVSATFKREQFRGLRAEIEYLTVGKSNLLKVVYRLLNETGIYWRAIPGLLTFCQPDGRYDNTMLHTDGVQLKRAQVMTWVVGGTWGTATNTVSGRTLVAVKGTPDAWMELSDWGQDGGHLFGFKRALIPPQGQAETIVFLGLANSLEDGRRYAALGK